ncbi:MAG: F0F1 ATP synthase subunit C [Candidatus Bipolaricaulota bacterium]|nr:F0F1 ATP synthase subunit C [Candidatus Bipolaricaulota bacterium]MDW8030457.1 F0F1 ATP synthase subunit C [Candidatus Bipolaricaulota bacterium]
MKRLALAVLIFNVIVVGACFGGLAQELAQDAESPLVAGLKTIAAAIAFASGAFATAWVQTRVGPAAMAAVAENRENFFSALVLVALPETLVVFGFVVIFLL